VQTLLEVIPSRRSGHSALAYVSVWAGVFPVSGHRRRHASSRQRLCDPLPCCSNPFAHLGSVSGLFSTHDLLFSFLHDAAALPVYRWGCIWRAVLVLKRDMGRHASPSDFASLFSTRVTCLARSPETRLMSPDALIGKLSRSSQSPIRRFAGIGHHGDGFVAEPRPVWHRFGTQCGAGDVTTNPCVIGHSIAGFMP